MLSDPSELLDGGIVLISSGKARDEAPPATDGRPGRGCLAGPTRLFEDPTMPDLNTGDILVQGKFHALMWVGGDKPIVHNVDKGKFHGVIRQSLKGALIGDKEAGEFFTNFSPDTYTVYRCSSPSIAQGAADYALGWATESGSPAMTEALQKNEGYLKTRYSHKRMEYAEYDATAAERQWSVLAMYRALKAYARYEAALTPKEGSSCSQFVVYCYQAASIRSLFGEMKIDSKSQDLLRQGGGSLKLKKRAEESTDYKNLMEQVEHAAEVFAKSALPLLKSNAKVEYVGSLLTRLNSEESGFVKLGPLVPNRGLTAAKYAPATQYSGWEAAIQAAGV
jgi:hypothetical protein